MSPPLRRPDSQSPPPTWPRRRLLCLLIFVGVGVGSGVPRPPSEAIEHGGAIDGERPPTGDALGPAGATEETEGDEAIRVAPQYMLELYRKFSNDKYSHPIANIVRSFKNINTGSAAVRTNGNGTRTELHTLQFNISNFGDGEEIFLAELRLFASAKTRTVSVYEVAKTPLPSATDSDETGSSQSPLRYRLLASRDRTPSAPAAAGSWETFAVTEVVRRWANTREIAGHVLEVRVDTAAPGVGGPQKEDLGGGGGGAGEGVVDGGYEPIIVVFSNDRKRRKIELRELHEIESRENEAREEEEEEEEEETTRRKSKNKNDYFPHSQSSPYSSTSSSAREEDDEEDEEDYDADPDPTRNQRNSTHEAAAWSNHSRPRSISDPPRKPTRVKRTLPNRGRHRRGERRNSCRRKPMYVDFRDVKWENWIIQPPGYQAYECTGQCYFPLQQRLTPTKYAMMKSLLHATYPKRASAVCCVPTRLEPISLLYLDEDDIVTYKYEYDEMVVAECGCR